MYTVWYDPPLWSDIQMHCTVLNTAATAAASHVEVLSSVGTHPLFIPITAAPVCPSQDIKADFVFQGIALPSLVRACPIIFIATFAHSIDNILWENVTVCILDGFKALTPRT